MASPRINNNPGNVVEAAETRDQRLRQIADDRGIIRELDAECIAWSLPLGQEAPRSKARWIKVNLLALCSPGTTIFESSGYDRTSVDSKLARFTSTLETRCIRDLKREFSWKIYGVSCNPAATAHAHYVRIKFDSAVKDQSFSALATLLDSLSVNRHVRLGVRPFGISGGIDTGAPNAADRLYMISNCAKQTPYLRKVLVDFEIYLEGEWRRLDHGVDRLGFATYRSTSRAEILSHDGHPDNINFKDDAYLRFARMTLRFGERKERTMIDVEGGEKSTLHVSHSKKTSTIYLPSVRVRTCDGFTVSGSRHTMCRLIFRDKARSPGGLLHHHSSKHGAAEEALKVARLIGKSTHLASKNTLRIKDSIADRDILEMAMQELSISDEQQTFKVKLEKEKYTFDVDLGQMFGRMPTMYIVPACQRRSSHGIILIVQSSDAKYVLRQHVDNPVDFISAITETGFQGPVASTLTSVDDRKRTAGVGRPRFAFRCADDAAMLVDRLVSLLTSIHSNHPSHQHAPSRLPLLATILAQKKRVAADDAGDSAGVVVDIDNGGSVSPRRFGHGRSGSNASNVSELSTNSSLAESEPDSPDAAYHLVTDPADWERDLDAAIHEIEAAAKSLAFDEPSVKTPVKIEKEEKVEGPQMLPVQVLCRVKKDFEPEELREVAVKRDEIVTLEYKADPWSFVRVSSGGEGWVPTSFLAFVE